MLVSIASCLTLSVSLILSRLYNNIYIIIFRRLYFRGCVLRVWRCVNSVEVFVESRVFDCAIAALRALICVASICVILYAIIGVGLRCSECVGYRCRSNRQLRCSSVLRRYRRFRGVNDRVSIVRKGRRA